MGSNRTGPGALAGGMADPTSGRIMRLSLADGRARRYT